MPTKCNANAYAQRRSEGKVAGNLNENGTSVNGIEDALAFKCRFISSM